MKQPPLYYVSTGSVVRNLDRAQWGRPVSAPQSGASAGRLECLGVTKVAGAGIICHSHVTPRLSLDDKSRATSGLCMRLGLLRAWWVWRGSILREEMSGKQETKVEAAWSFIT